MQLDFEKIKEITFGFVNAFCDDEGMHFRHCTDSQTKTWYGVSEKYGLRSTYTTGAMIDVITDAQTVTFTAKHGKFEVLLNGLLFEQYKLPADEFKTVNVSLPKGENRFTLVFPSQTEGVLKDISFDSDNVKPYKYDRKFLFLGDSITQGWNASFDTNSYAHRVSNHFNAERVIVGIGGTFFKPDAFEKIDYNPDKVIVAFGCNDLKARKTKEQLYDKVYNYLKLVVDTYGKEKIIGIIPIWRWDEEKIFPMGTFAECRQIISDIYDSFGCFTVDGYEIVPHIKEFYFDCLHPNDLGFAHMADGIIKRIKDIV